MTGLGLDEDTPIENTIVSRSLEGAQKKVEGHNFDIRKSLVEYDDVMNKHRTSIYARRRRALENENLRPEIIEMVEHELEAMVSAHIDTRTGVADVDQILEAAGNIMSIEPIKADMQKAHPSEYLDMLKRRATEVYEERANANGELMPIAERLTYLRTLDSLWIEHLDAMDDLRNGIGLRAIGQRDPLVEYKSEGFKMFKNLVAVMDAEIANTIFKVSITRNEPASAPVETELTKAARQANINAVPAGTAEKPADKPQPKRNSLTAKVGRNDLCPCGSGLKYKKCGAINAPQHRG
jgi:preprotein translocase subunit SecA